LDWEVLEGYARISRAMRENFPHKRKCAETFSQILGFFAKNCLGIVTAKEIFNNVLTAMVI